MDESKQRFTKVSKAKKEREYARAKVFWPLSILTVQGPLEGEDRDISLTGALIYCHELPDPDSPIPMAIEIPEQHHFIFATGEMIGLDIEGEEREHPRFFWVFNLQRFLKRTSVFSPKKSCTNSNISMVYALTEPFVIHA